MATIKGKAARDFAKKHGIEAPKKKHKYGAIKTVVDGVTFSSKKEAARYSELKTLERAGEICGLTLQPRYPLHSRTGSRMCFYVADFLYFEGPQPVRRKMRVEDVKGMRTPMYRLKKKWAESEHGIKIVEV